MRHNLGITLCESLVNTKLRYVLKSMENFGSQNTVATVQVSLKQYVYAINATIELNALNGVSITKDMESGAVLPQSREKVYVVSQT